MANTLTGKRVLIVHERSIVVQQRQKALSALGAEVDTVIGANLPVAKTIAWDAIVLEEPSRALLAQALAGTCPVVVIGTARAALAVLSEADAAQRLGLAVANAIDAAGIAMKSSDR